MEPGGVDAAAVRSGLGAAVITVGTVGLLSVGALWPGLGGATGALGTTALEAGVILVVGLFLSIVTVVAGVAVLRAPTLAWAAVVAVAGDLSGLVVLLLVVRALGDPILVPTGVLILLIGAYAFLLDQRARDPIAEPAGGDTPATGDRGQNP